MFRLTGEAKWHDEFKRGLQALYKGDLSKAPVEGPSPVVSYALMPAAQADAKAQRLAKRVYGVGPERYEWDERLGSGWSLASAHRLSGDAKSLAALEKQAQFALGLNPFNASYTTGLGSRQVVPFNFEAHYLGVPYPDGITTYGPAPRNIWRGARMEETLNKSGLYPAWENWPWAESYFNVRIPNINEYVVGGNMANVLLSRAYIAQALAKP